MVAGPGHRPVSGQSSVSVEALECLWPVAVRVKTHHMRYLQESVLVGRRHKRWLGREEERERGGGGGERERGREEEREGGGGGEERERYPATEDTGHSVWSHT